MTEVQKNACWTLKKHVEGFLRNTRIANCTKIVEILLESLKILDCNMSKLYFLRRDLDKFADILDTVSDKQNEQFHQDLKFVKERYHCRWDKYMIAYCCWNLTRDFLQIEHARRYYK